MLHTIQQDQRKDSMRSWNTQKNLMTSQVGQQDLRKYEKKVQLNNRISFNTLREARR